jgi:phosphomannomutase
LQVLFAFEEAIGFMIGAMFKDKDGVAAAAVFAELAASLYAEGKTVSLFPDPNVKLSKAVGSIWAPEEMPVDCAR